MLGLTFKPDVPDLRNSKVVDVVRRLTWLGHRVTIHDPLADPAAAEREHGLRIEPRRARAALRRGRRRGAAPRRIARWARRRSPRSAGPAR